MRLTPRLLESLLGSFFLGGTKGFFYMFFLLYNPVIHFENLRIPKGLGGERLSLIPGVHIYLWLKMRSKGRKDNLSDSRDLDGSYDQLTGNVPNQNKKAFKQRILKLLPCCGPTDTPSVSENSVEDDFELSTVCHRPEGLEQLQEQSKFTKKELQVLYRGFKNECPSGIVNEENFKQIYSQFFPQGDSSMYAHFLFNAFDTDHNGSVSFEDFVAGLSIILRGTIDDKLNWAFNLYDLNKDGCITKEEMMDIMKSIYDMMGKYTYPNMREEAPREHVENFFQKMDRNKDGVVTIDEFIESCQKDENIMRSMQLFDNVI